jgi:tetratricopeptide (TPR) repeat protein
LFPVCPADTFPPRSQIVHHHTIDRERMTWWRRLVGGSSGRDKRTTDFLTEALELEARGDFVNALTSYRLALRERPEDLRVLQNIAIAFSKTGQPEEAIRTYRRALQIDPELAGAHYGLAFLLLKRGDAAHAAMHLEAFLRHSPSTGGEAAKFRAHARATLDAMQAAADGAPPPDDALAAGDDGHRGDDDGTAPSPHGMT